MVEKKTKILFLLALFTSLLSAQGSWQLRYTVNESWNFIKDENIADVEGFLLSKNNTSVIDLPHTWNDKDVVDEKEGFYRGSGWYSKEIKIPTAYRNKQVYLFFEGVAMVSEVYINKKMAKRHVGGFTRFVVPVSKYIDFNEDEEFTVFDVVIKANNSENIDVPPLNADFTFFGGVYRDVNLVVTEKIHFNLEDYAANGVFITTPHVCSKRGDVCLKVRIKNDDNLNRKVTLISRIYGPKDELVNSDSRFLKLIAGKSNEFDFKLKPVPNPMLWSPDTPNMYKVVCNIYDSETKESLDVSINPLGFRWFSFDAEKGFFLNGKHLKLIGTNRHQDFKDIGNAVPDHIHREDILRLKAMGSNFLRIAHYPQDPIILELCDRLGIIASVETPIIDRVTESEEFAQNCLNAHLEMIRQNYNHPSLLIWAYMNEVLLHPPYKSDIERYKKYCTYLCKLAQRIEDLTRTEDPYRYTMIPNHNNVEKYKDAGLSDIPKIIGFNIYLGWYGGGYELLNNRLEEFRQGVKQPIIITEYGAGVDPRLHALYPVRFDFTHEYGTEQHQYYLNVIKSKSYIAGASVWNYADFNSESRVDAVQSINNKGLVGLDRKPKDVFYYYQASLLKIPFIAIATKSWNQRTNIEDVEGSGISTMPVQVFSNQDRIELMVNGKSLGIRNVENAIAVFDVPFINGINKLRAINKTVEYVEDLSEVRINVVPFSLKKFPEGGISINVGDMRFFYDDKIDQAWMFDREYSEGSWGHIGGEPYVRPGKRKQQPYGAKQVIAGTPNDPIYQTQLIGIKQYRFDVPAGVYEIKLHFAELEGRKVKHLPYDLSDESGDVAKAANRTFSVNINGQSVLSKIDILGEYGEYRAVKYKSLVSVKEGEPVIVDFKKIVGEPILNAIEIFKKL